MTFLCLAFLKDNAETVPVDEGNFCFPNRIPLQLNKVVDHVNRFHPQYYHLSVAEVQKRYVTIFCFGF